MLDYYPDRYSPVLEVKGQGHLGTKKTRFALPRPTQLAYEWYALAASGRLQQWTSAFAGS